MLPFRLEGLLHDRRTKVPLLPSVAGAICKAELNLNLCISHLAVLKRDLVRSHKLAPFRRGSF